MQLLQQAVWLQIWLLARQYTDGLPPVKVHCSLLAEESIHAALWDYCKKHNVDIPGLKEPKKDVHDGEEEIEDEE